MQADPTCPLFVRRAGHEKDATQLTRTGVGIRVYGKARILPPKSSSYYCHSSDSLSQDVYPFSSVEAHADAIYGCVKPFEVISSS